MLRVMHFLLLLFPLLVSACSDTTPPSWVAGAALEAVPEATQIRVTWPDPVDDDVLVFVVSVDGVERTRTTSSTHTVMVGELEDETIYTLEVTALDQDENPSTPLSIRVETLDGTPPQWPQGAELVATSPDPPDAEERRVELGWPAALDATTYSVSRQAIGVGRTEATTHQIPDAPLTAETTFEVRALDEAGNESEPLSVVWGETTQAAREAEAPVMAIRATDREADPRLLTILGVLSGDSGGNLADVFSDGVELSADDSDSAP